jgi:hypothetical protein
MIAYRKRLERSLKAISKEVVMITCPLSIRKGREKERVLERRVTMMEDYQLGKKKDLSKIKCFSCHKNEHYVSQFLEKKKVKGNMHIKTST